MKTDISFTPSERVILERLISSDVTTQAQIFTLLWGNNADGGPDSAENLLRVHMYRIGKKLSRYGVLIDKTRKSYGLGLDGKYRLNAKDREIVGDLLERTMWGNYNAA